MKASAEFYEAVREAVEPLDTVERRQHYIDGTYPRAERTKDVNMRYRWDLLWASGISLRDTEGYEGLNDSHIDTVLRNIVDPLVG